MLCPSHFRIGPDNLTVPASLVSVY